MGSQKQAIPVDVEGCDMDAVLQWQHLMDINGSWAFQVLLYFLSSIMNPDKIPQLGSSVLARHMPITLYHSRIHGRHAFCQVDFLPEPIVQMSPGAVFYNFFASCFETTANRTICPTGITHAHFCWVGFPMFHTLGGFRMRLTQSVVWPRIC